MRAASVVRLWIPTIAVALSAACLPPEGEPQEAPLEQTSQPIVGGTRQMQCQWPTAVGAAGCTNTLVHPLVVTTAGHCVGNSTGAGRTITFGETWSGAGVVRRVPVRRCYNGTASGVRGDFGFCVLAEPVNDVPIVPVLFGCETAILKQGQQATLVGYGRLSGTTSGAGTKYAVNVTINRVSATEVLLGNATNSACNGDSGGPAFVKLADGTWRAFGATSRGSQRCNAATIYTLIHPFVPWMERTSGIDITPCHDADGKWNPGPGCRNFPMNPEASNGAWPTMCTSVQRSGLAATCGAAFDGTVPDGGPTFPTTDAGARDGGGAGGGRDGGARDVVAMDAAPAVPDVAPDVAPIPDADPENTDVLDPGFSPPPDARQNAPTMMTTPPVPANNLSEPSGGCACDVGGGATGSGGPAGLLLMAGVALLVRRRRRGPQL